MTAPLPDPRLARLMSELDEERKRRKNAERATASVKGTNARLRATIARLEAQQTNDANPKRQQEQRPAC